MYRTSPVRLDESVFLKSPAPSSNKPLLTFPASAWMKSNGASIVWAASVWFVIGLLTLMFSFAIMFCAACLLLADPKRKFLHWLATLWGRSIFLCTPSWRLTVTGREHIDPQKPYILISNHQSLLDIMALFCLRRQFKWVAKASLFKIPFVGWSMSLTRYIKLVRGKSGSVRHAYDQARRWLSAGISVFFFPEGTRSRTGQLGPFKNGAFKLALDTGIPIVPIVITGTRELLSRGNWLFRRRSHVRITVLPPINPARYHQQAGIVRLRNETRHLIHQTLINFAPQ